MLRFLAQTVLSLLANAIGLFVANSLLDGFSINGLSFVIAVAIFTFSTAILGPFVLKVALKNAPYLVGGIALVTTAIGLVLTNIFSSGISINGLSTWFVATFVVWLFSVIANVVLPLFIFKQLLAARQRD